MKIVIAGGTGFLGRPLAEMYAEEGHDVRVLTRSLPDGESRHDPGTGMPGVTRVGWAPGSTPAAPSAGHAVPSATGWAASLDDADAQLQFMLDKS